MAQMLGRRFARILGWPVLGDVLEKNVQTDFLEFSKRWPKCWEGGLREFLDSRFWGMFWKKCPNRFGEMEQNRLQQTWPKCWEGGLREFLDGRFWGMFWIIRFGELYRYILSVIIVSLVYIKVLYILKSRVL